MLHNIHIFEVNFKQKLMEYLETKTEILSLYSDAEKINDKRFYTLCLLALETGGRVSDLTILKWSSFDFSKKVVSFKNHKSKKVQTQNFSDTLKNILLEYQNNMQRFYGVNDNVFFNPNSKDNVVKRVSITRRCKNEFGFGFHEFRRLSARNIANQKGVVGASKFLGHSRTSTTDIYLGISNEAYLEDMKTCII